MAKNVQGVIFLRNGNLFETREAALAVLTGSSSTLLTRLNDGEMALARYGSGNNVKTLAGIMYKNGDNKSITVIDVEGASGDVEKLRQEINAKLGDGVGSGASETVTAQLTALSGNAQSTSAETSVAGAKAYADNLIGTLDGGVTAETGSYVVSVSEVDGKISGTTAVLPSSADTAEAKKVVIAVSEDKGQIEVTRGDIVSTDKTVKIAETTDGENNITGINFEVNIDNDTLQKDADGVISVTSSALVQYEGDDDTVQIGAVQDGKRIVSSPLTISATTPSEANVKEQYNLVGASGNTIGATIKIYKDSALLSVALLHAITTETPQVLPTYNKATNTWTDIDATAQTQANQALCYAYEDVSGNTVVAAVPVGAFINEQEFASGVTWDAAAGKVKGVVDTTSEKDSQDTPVDFLTVGADGFKVSGIKDEIDRKINALDATGGTQTIATGKHVAVEVVEANGLITAVTVAEDNIADADDLAALSAKTITDIDSANGSITVTPANAADGTKEIDLATDADKIQMSGFSADNTSALSGIAESDSIATAFEKTNAVITENERVTAGALNDLDGRLDVVEGEYISGVSVNGNAVTLANKVAPISITPASAVPTATVSDPAIVVNTDNTGAITLGIGYIDCGTYDDPQP